MPVIYPFERFSELSKRVLVLTQEEAQKAGHAYIGTEHLLLGLLREPDGLAAKVLWGLEIYIDAVRAKIEQVVGSETPPKAGQVVPTSNVKRSIELAFEEARKMRSDLVGTEHLLLGLLAEGTSIAPHVLSDMGAGLSSVRAGIERLRLDGVVEAPGLEVQRIFEVRSRVLVHDREPPHRLWEGRITGPDGDRFQVEIPGHPDGEAFLVEPDRMHPIPLRASRKCALCQAS